MTSIAKRQKSKRANDLGFNEGIASRKILDLELSEPGSSNSATLWLKKRDGSGEASSTAT